MNDETVKTFYMLYLAWCLERELDYKDGDNKQNFLDEILPEKGSDDV